MNRTCALILFLLFGTAINAKAWQDEISSPLYSLPDSNNIRLHLSAFANILSEQNFWNPHTKRYEALLPQVLQSKLLVRPPFRKVLALQKEKDVYYAYSNWYKDKDSLASVLNREHFDDSDLYAKKELQYDELGRLTFLSTERFFKDNKDGYTDLDTILITYTQLPNDSLLIQVSERTRQEAKKSFFSCVYFRHSFRQKPLVVREFRDNSYLFDAHQRLLRHTYHYDIYANGEKGSWKEDNQRDFTYDSLGRIVSIKDSLTTLKQLQSIQTFQYTDRKPVDSAMLLGSVQLQRWIRNYPGAYTQTTTETAQWLMQHDYDSVILLQPQTVRQTVTKSIFSKAGQQIGQLPENDISRNFWVLQEFTDSLGHLYGWYEVHVPSENEDTSWYKPGSIGDPMTLRMGCVVEMYNERPRGTLELNHARVLNKKTTVQKDRSRLITYDYNQHGGGLHTYWAPVHYRYTGESMSGFMLTTPDGRLNYLQDDRYLYRIIYKP